MTRAALLRLSTVVLSLILTLLVLEGALRVYHWGKNTWIRWRLPELAQRAVIPSDDPELIFVFNPGWTNGEFSVNAFGMANRETTREKPDGMYRIAFVGDSISAGFGLRPREQLYLNVAEGLLNERASGGATFETLNFGVNGYGIRQSLRMAETRVPPFEPDLLVAQLCLNDPYPSPLAHERLAPVGPSRLYNLLERRLHPDRFFARTYVDGTYDERGWASLRRGLEGFARLARERPVQLILFPYLYQPAYDRWGYDALHRRYADMAERRGLALLDLLGAFRAADLIGDTWPIDPLHPDASGHRIAAELLVETLERRGLLPVEMDVNAGAPVR